tara:strand:- start:1 stop:291 length:291 start_codon:yes stop_codon:yes gene_type:complete
VSSSASITLFGLCFPVLPGVKEGWGLALEKMITFCFDKSSCELDDEEEEEEEEVEEEADDAVEENGPASVGSVVFLFFWSGMFLVVVDVFFRLRQC